MQPIRVPSDNRLYDSRCDVLQKTAILRPEFAGIGTDVVVFVDAHEQPTLTADVSLTVLSLPLHPKAGRVGVMANPKVDSGRDGRQVHTGVVYSTPTYTSRGTKHWWTSGGLLRIGIAAVRLGV